ncbi:MAG: tripartite tricarboxylate transporter substrate binding protein [Hyphomicrobiaceae bacterium]|nr:tripartite tricarboxylate transporter substrate binding protein [Hyphomicrobiaceae bacterium]
MRRRNFLMLAAGAGAAGVLSPSVLRAQAAWPEKPVKLIVPFAAGGGTDLVARPWADKLTQAFGQQFVVENRGGASGMIGTEAAAKAAPDGYTFLLSSNTTPVNLPLLRKVPYDPNALHPVARVGDTVTGFVTNPASGLKSFKEMLDYAKKNPGKLAFGSSGPGTLPHLRMEMLVYRTGINLLHVPYRGGADALTDLLAGNVQLMNEPACNPHAKASKLVMLTMNHTVRSPEFPDVPTLTELGYPNSDVPLWFSIWAPAGVPPPILEKLHAKVTEISKTADMIAKLQIAGAAAVTSTQAELIAFREKESNAMAQLIKTANIKLE